MTATNPSALGWAEEARNIFLRYLREECGDEVADCREDGILSGREDSEEFIQGFLAAARLCVSREEAELLREEIVELWHCGNSKRPLHEHLGMTWEQYAEWASGAALKGQSKEAGDAD
jgi:hypothetical protein